MVHFGGFGAQNVEIVFFMLGWDRYRFDQKRVRTRYAEPVFFAYGGICGSHSAFWCIRGAKHQCTIFYALVGLAGFLKKRTGKIYVELVFLDLVGSAGHVVHSDISGM
jgi:hypothetical protein